MLERVGSRVIGDIGNNAKDNNFVFASSLMISPDLRDISNNNSDVNSRFVTSNNGKVYFEHLKKQTERM